MLSFLFLTMVKASYSDYYSLNDAFDPRYRRGWTLNSIGYNRGFSDVLKKLIDYKMTHRPAMGIAKRMHDY